MTLIDLWRFSSLREQVYSNIRTPSQQRSNHQKGEKKEQKKNTLTRDERRKT
jgi:hypothetical protein